MSPRSWNVLLFALIGPVSLPTLIRASPIEYTARILPEENAGGRGLAEWKGGGGRAEWIDPTPFRSLQADVPRVYNSSQDFFSSVSGAWANPNLPDLAVYRLESSSSRFMGPRDIHTSLILAQRDPDGVWKILTGVGGGPNDDLVRLVGINDSGSSQE